MRLKERIGMYFGRKGAISAALAGSLLGIFVSVMGCSANTEDPVFGTRLPDIGTEMETPTPISTVPTLTPTPSREYIATPVVAQPTVQAVDTPTPVPSPTPLPTVAPTPTPIRLIVGDSGMTDEELEAARQQMLDLINAGRLEAELDAVVLDDNPSAQLHANDMLANCFLSQWGTDGSKPTLRYNVGGGIGASYSFQWGSSYCPGDPYRYEWDPIAEEVVSGYRSLNDDFGVHEGTYKRVGIGLSYQRPNLWVSLVFTTDHLRYIDEPKLENGILTFAYELTNGAVAGDDLVDSFVHYDVPLMALSRGQLSRTASSGLGRRIAGIRPPAGADSYYPEDEFSVEASTCRDPYEMDENVAPPGTYDASVAISREARLFCQSATPVVANAKWVTSGVERYRSGVRVTSDIQDLVSQFGAGIYTLQIWAVVDGIDAPVSEYSIFVE